MFKYIIDIFCKDTVVGLSDFDDIKKNTIYKNKYSSLFNIRKEYKLNSKTFSIDQFAYHL